MDSLPPHQNSTNPGLCLSLHIPLAFLPPLPFSALYLPSLPHHAILVDGEYRQYREWFDLLCGALHCSWHSLTRAAWSLDGTDGIGSGFWMEAEMPAGISLSAGFTNLHSGLDFKPLLPGFEFQNHLRWRWYFNTWLSRIVIPTQNKQNWGWISSR